MGSSLRSFVSLLSNSVRLAFLLTASAAPVFAHTPSDSYVSLDVERGQISCRWDIAMRDLDQVLHLDTNDDGVVMWGEVREQRGKISGYVFTRLSVSGDGVAGRLRQEQLLFESHPDGMFAVFRFSVEGLSSPRQLEVTYRLFFDHDPLHRGLMRLTQGSHTQAAVFNPQTATQRFDLAEASATRQFLAFTNEGVWHIWKGYDHVLFLLALLLPAVLRREGFEWRVVENFQPAFIHVFKIVTAFTVAHSITLSLAALELVSLPSRLVESTIAASVALAALNNLRPIFHGRGWMVAFVFGLIHGFGFATVLGEMGLSRGSLAIPLVSFNVGVEAGQLAIVALFLPLAYAARASWFYQRLTLRLGSTGVALIAVTWMAERLFDFKALPF
jgi:hypothetical protein